MAALRPLDIRPSKEQPPRGERRDHPADRSLRRGPGDSARATRTRPGWPWAALLALALHCDEPSEPAAPPGLYAVVGAQSACAGSLREVTLVLRNRQGESNQISRKTITRTADLPYRVAIALPQGEGSYTLIATFTTGAPEAQATQSVTLQAGASGRLTLTLPCVCIGKKCAEGENCREEKVGSGKAVCEPTSTCGDGTCDEGEDTLSCQNDCPSSCGDGLCPEEESCSDCPQDCGPCKAAGAGGVGGAGGAGQAGASPAGGAGAGAAGAVKGCGDGACDSSSESKCTCPQDCGDPGCGECNQPPCQGCNNGACEQGETCKTCPQDCGSCPPECNDGVCNGDETCQTCALDCGDGCYSVFARRSYDPAVGHWLSVGCIPPGFLSEGAARLRAEGPGKQWFLCERSKRRLASLDAGCEGGVNLGAIGWADSTDKNGGTEIFRCDIGDGADIFFSPDKACEGAGAVGQSFGFARASAEAAPPCPVECGDAVCSVGEGCPTCAKDCGDGCYSVRVVRSVGPLDHWVSLGPPPPGYTPEATVKIRAEGDGVAWYLCAIGGRSTISKSPSCEGGELLQLAGWADAALGNGTVEVFRCALGGGDHLFTGDPGCEGVPGAVFEGSFGFVRPGP